MNLSVKNRGESSKWLLTRFYGNLRSAKRKGSWELLQAIKPPSEVGWYMIGDFNKIVS